MRRVIEQMHGGYPGRQLAHASVGRRTILDRRFEPFGRKASRPVENPRIGGRAHARENVEIVVEVGTVRRHAIGLAAEARKPDAIRPYEVVQRAVDRAKESAAIALALLVRKRGKRCVEPLVHPSPVAGEQLAVRGRDHAIATSAGSLTASSASISTAAASCASRATTPYA